MGVRALSSQGLATVITIEQLAQMFQTLPEPEPVILKLYYNDAGEPIEYTCETRDGNYIEVDPETFAFGSMQVRVENGVLKQLPPATYVHKLQPSDAGTLCHAQDVTVVTSNTGTYWKRQTYESS